MNGGVYIQLCFTIISLLLGGILCGIGGLNIVLGILSLVKDINIIKEEGENKDEMESNHKTKI